MSLLRALGRACGSWSASRKLKKATGAVLEALECRQMLSICADDTLTAFSYNGTAYNSPFLQQAPTPAVTSTGIALASGSYVGTSVDLASDFLGMGWGHTRSWSNTAGLGPNGNHCVVSQMPYLVQDNNANSTLIAVDGGVSQRWFDWSDSTWTARMYIQDTLAANTGSNEFVLTDPAGSVWSTGTTPTSTTLPA